MTAYRFSIAACGLALLSGLSGCADGTKGQEDSRRKKARLELSQITAAYRAYTDANEETPPSSADDLAKWAQEKMPEAVPAINQARPGGKYVFYWDVPEVLKSIAVLGYEATAPSQGGLVVMTEGHEPIRYCSAEQFPTLPRPPAKGISKRK